MLIVKAYWFAMDGLSSMYKGNGPERQGSFIMRTTIFLLLFLTLAVPQAVFAQTAKGCSAMDRLCLIKSLEQIAPTIPNSQDRDQVYRKMARALTLEGQPDKAIGMLTLVSSSEQKALMMGDIGKAAAEANFTPVRLRAIFQKLLDEAKATKQDKARGMAYAEIGIAQSLAGDTAGARAAFTNLSGGMQKDRAFAWAGVMRAQAGDPNGAADMIAAIATQSYRNKAHRAVCNVFLEKAQITEAYACASRIDNAYLRAEAIQKILDKGNEDKVSIKSNDDLAKILDSGP